MKIWSNYLAEEVQRKYQMGLYVIGNQVKADLAKVVKRYAPDPKAKYKFTVGTSTAGGTIDGDALGVSVMMERVDAPHYTTFPVTIDLVYENPNASNAYVRVPMEFHDVYDVFKREMEKSIKVAIAKVFAFGGCKEVAKGVETNPYVTTKDKWVRFALKVEFPEDLEESYGFDVVSEETDELTEGMVFRQNYRTLRPAFKGIIDGVCKALKSESGIDSFTPARNGVGHYWMRNSHANEMIWDMTVNGKEGFMAQIVKLEFAYETEGSDDYPILNKKVRVTVSAQVKEANVKDTEKFLTKLTKSAALPSGCKAGSPKVEKHPMGWGEDFVNVIVISEVSVPEALCGTPKKK